MQTAKDMNDIPSDQTNDFPKNLYLSKEQNVIENESDNSLPLFLCLVQNP